MSAEKINNYFFDFVLTIKKLFLYLQTQKREIPL